jgi:hypothetical protein
MSNATTERAVGQLEGSVKALQADMDGVKKTLAGQDDKLDKLLAYHHQRKGAKAVTKAAVAVVTSGGFIGWLVEHFTK